MTRNCLYIYIYMWLYVRHLLISCRIYIYIYIYMSSQFPLNHWTMPPFLTNLGSPNLLRRIPRVKELCIRRHFGGFVLHEDYAYFRLSSPEANPMEISWKSYEEWWFQYGKYMGNMMGNMMESMGSKQNEPVPSRKMCGWRVCCTTSYLGLVWWAWTVSFFLST